ncbi:hypothetical protein [Novipirellula galeiformis]|uniref:hypothetical protein n=1 Tax=Novipirellula galeiformis TaxID=2528004 RepID=UPI0011B6B572|nr:hypothetical protein [Novipirellula galeiformis]
MFLTLLLVQVSPVFGQDPSVEPLDPSPLVNRPLAHRGDGADAMEGLLHSEKQSLAFEETSFSLNKEGYLSLRWNEISDATQYILVDQQQRELYRGAFPVAFVSGLSDGTHPFHVQALDADGSVIATTRDPAVVVVEHWPMRYAIGLFVVGLAVFVTLLALIVRGSTRPRSVPPVAAGTDSQESLSSGRDTDGRVETDLRVEELK